MQRILERQRWFFLQISGRRRIGKTALIQEALKGAGIAKTLYVQIPDSDPAGVVAACNGYLETFGINARVASLGELAQLIGRLAADGYVVALDEFQYFHRKQLSDFCSLLQAEVDRLAAHAADIPGGLIVLGSLHAEMTAMLENRDAPLFRRDARLADVEGYALEDLVGQLYEERSRLGIGDFPLSERIRGYWDRADVEIDLVAVNEDEQRIRFGTCKRNPEKLLGALDDLKRSADRFLASHARFNGWRYDYVAIGPTIDPEIKSAIEARSVIPQSLADLISEL